MSHSQRTLGRSAVKVTRFGLGTAALSSPSTEPLAETVRRALAAGIGVADTAPMYGCGDAEVALGAALPTDASVTLSTKVGRVIRPFASGETSADVPDVHTTRHSRRTHFDFSADGVRQSHRESMARLGGRRPDVVCVPDPDRHEGEAWRGAIPEVLRWRDQG